MSIDYNEMVDNFVELDSEEFNKLYGESQYNLAIKDGFVSVTNDKGGKTLYERRNLNTSVNNGLSIEDRELILNGDIEEVVAHYREVIEDFNKAETSYHVLVPRILTKAKILTYRTKVEWVEKGYNNDRVDIGSTFMTKEAVAYCSKEGSKLFKSLVLVYSGGASYRLGSFRKNYWEADLQKVLRRKHFIATPVTDLSSVDVIETGPEETFSVDPSLKGNKASASMITGSAMHFGGACLYTTPSGKEEGGFSYFLVDVDRNEIEKGLVNIFQAQLASPASSIKEAYEGLKPPEVLTAELQGLDIKRQGEWFFIKRVELPVNLEDLAALQIAYNLKASGRSTSELNAIEVADQYLLSMPAIMDKVTKYMTEPLGRWDQLYPLRANDNRPLQIHFTCFAFNTPEGIVYRTKPLEDIPQDWDVLVRGVIKHSNNEHMPLDLGSDTWWEAVPNTSTGSIKLTGVVD